MNNMNNKPSHPGVFAQKTPNKPAIIMGGSGQQISFGEFEEISCQIAHMMCQNGLSKGDRVAVLLENHPLYMPIAWGVFRAGLRFVAVATHLTQKEIDYILNDSGAALFITSKAMEKTVLSLQMKNISSENRFVTDGEIRGFNNLQERLSKQEKTETIDQVEGIEMLYSSGTTGMPKGILKPMPTGTFGVPSDGYKLTAKIYGFDEKTIYLSTAPQYHAAPLLFSLRTLRFGATVVIMEKFDAETSLRLIQKYKITHSQWVPTMFIRLLQLPEHTRLKYDLSSLNCVIHAAAPCPVEIKQQMLDWWGPIIWEYYGGSEGNGLTVIDSKEWLLQKGSVGKAKIGRIRICGDDGEELAVGETGLIYFSEGPIFEYNNDRIKTAESRNQYDWSTMGDIGHINEGGYLFITDRKANMIISGGVNIYPQESENRLLSHPEIRDVAVIGVPNSDFGEEVKGIVQLINPEKAGEDLAQELIEFCWETVSKIKSPRSIDFVTDLPRRENGKLYKKLLKQQYWK